MGAGIGKRMVVPDDSAAAYARHVNGRGRKRDAVSGAARLLAGEGAREAAGEVLSADLGRLLAQPRYRHSHAGGRCHFETDEPGLLREDGVRPAGSGDFVDDTPKGFRRPNAGQGTSSGAGEDARLGVAGVLVCGDYGGTAPGVCRAEFGPQQVAASPYRNICGVDLMFHPFVQSGMFEGILIRGTECQRLF
jgi:hypothetical protein